MSVAPAFDSGQNLWFADSPDADGITLGMEWEVPFSEEGVKHKFFHYHNFSNDDGGWNLENRREYIDTRLTLASSMFEPERANKIMKKMKLKKLNPLLHRGFQHEFGLFQPHTDSGGWEVVSPVCKGQAALKEWASNVLTLANKTEDFDTKKREKNSCGIHVHVLHPDVVSPSDWGRTLGSFLNTKQDHVNKDFLQALSMRPNSTNWGDQGISRWFEEGDLVHSGLHYCSKGTVRYNGYGTIEYRLFSAHEDLRDVSVEFAHALTKWAVGTLPSAPKDGQTLWSAIQGGFNLPEFKRWLKKQDYPTLHRNDAINNMIG